MDVFRALRYARRYRNWRELARARSRGHKPHRAHLWRGWVFESPSDVNVLRSVTAGYFKGYYTPPGFEIAPDDVVIDVGANIGAFSVYAAERTRRPVCAIEPAPANAAFLRRNIERAALGIQVVEAALLDRDGSADLLIAPNGTEHTLRRRGAKSDDLAVRVRALTLSALLDSQALDRIDLLKLDCEGAEGAILRSTEQKDLDRIRRISMEFHDTSSCWTHSEIQAHLNRAGFETRLLWDGRAPTGYIYASR